MDFEKLKPSLVKDIIESIGPTKEWLFLRSLPRKYLLDHDKHYDNQYDNTNQVEQIVSKFAIPVLRNQIDVPEFDTHLTLIVKPTY
ncbi:MAG: hypothetical protein BAJALOKI1v1_2070003 [Promethearchaeota archaeon]|nr:MAG: hypothetical protein BAJALOKI1v1_2070003 [Candidatus Lokiarchaeota archaeon]